MQIKNILLDFFIFLIMLTSCLAYNFLNKYEMINICFLIVVLFVNALNKYSLECSERNHVFQ